MGGQTGGQAAGLWLVPCCSSDESDGPACPLMSPSRDLSRPLCTYSPAVSAGPTALQREPHPPLANSWPTAFQRC